jgi:hypothetical protein
VKSKVIVKQKENLSPNRTNIYTNPIERIPDNQSLRPYRKWRLAPPSP